MDDLTTLTVVLATAIGVNIVKLSKSFKNQVYNSYHLSWVSRFRLSSTLDKEFFIWAWAFAKHYGTNICKGRYGDSEASLYQTIFVDYFEVVCKGNDSLMRLGYWSKNAREACKVDKYGFYYDKKELPEFDNSRYVELLSIIVLKRIVNDVKNLGPEEIYEIWGKKLSLVSQSLDIAVRNFEEIIGYYLYEADETDTLNSFKKAKSEKPVANLIKKWQSG